MLSALEGGPYHPIERSLRALSESDLRDTMVKSVNINIIKRIMMIFDDHLLAHMDLNRSYPGEYEQFLIRIELSQTHGKSMLHI